MQQYLTKCEVKDFHNNLKLDFMFFKFRSKHVLGFAFLFVLFSITSCVKKEFDAVPKAELEEIAPDAATMTIAELKAIRGNAEDNTITPIPENTVIVGQVISSDKEGNIYKELYIQDSTSGITVRVDGSVLYTTFQLGQKIAIDCNDLVLGSYGQRVQIGMEGKYNGAPSAIQIPLPFMVKHTTFGKIYKVEPKVITIQEANSKLNEYAGMYVRIENVQVSKNDKGKNYAEEDKTTNRYFSSCKNGTDIVLRSSGYADFQSEILPDGLGNIEATLTRFRDTPQLIINSPADMKDFTGNTVELPECQAPDPEKPTIVKTLNETFDGKQYDQLKIEGWNNIVETGSKGWMYNAHESNSYANISVYTTSEARKSWLITPILDVAHATNKIVHFETRADHLDGATLKVYVSADFDGSKAPSEFLWREIPAKIGTSGKNDYGQWTASGDIDLSTFGNVVLAFVYEGEEHVKDGGYSIDNFVFNKDGDVTPPEPGDYYGPAEGKTGYELKTALHKIISSNTVDVGYKGLWEAYNTTDDKYGKKHIVWDIYSDIPDPNNPTVPDGKQPGEYEYVLGDDQNDGHTGPEGTNYNREHTMPQSWFNKQYPMRSDIFQVLPTDSKVNGMRGNNPYGEVENTTWTSVNGSKLGTDANGHTVFEPIDEYKGDVARIYFYMATRYEDQIGSWENNTENADLVLDGSNDKVFEDWELEILKQWAESDPVSQKERDRNEDVYKIQHNRNPFVDHPEYIQSIWGD